MTCFICDPDNPEANDEGCSECEGRHVNEYVIPSYVAMGLDQEPSFEELIQDEISRDYARSANDDR